MRNYNLTILLLGLIFQAHAQQNNDAGQQFIQKKCSIVRTSLPLDKYTVANYPVLFDSIRVLDYRSDTSRIGIVGTEPRYQQDIRFHHSVAAQVSAYLNGGYTYSKGSYHLLVVIKKLWVSNHHDLRFSQLDKPAWRISFRFEAYAPVQNGYIPISYLDTTVFGSGLSAAFTTTRVVPDLIARFMDKLAAHDLDVDVIAKRAVSFEQVDSFCRAAFDYPLDTATTLVKGVYATVQEFRNNQPSILQYEITKEKGGDLTLSIPDGSGHFVYTHTVWGFCDGTQAFVMMDGNVFPILRVHHQFYVLGSREYRNNPVWIPLFLPLGPGGGLAGIMDVSDKIVRTLRLFRLNVHSGKITE